MTEITNAKITDTFLGMDHGCITAWVTLEGNSWGCSYGGYCLGHWSCKPGEHNSPYGLGAIVELMKALEVESWEALKGQYVRIESEGWGGRVLRIGHLMKEKWFSFEDYFKVCKGEDA